VSAIVAQAIWTRQHGERKMSQGEDEQDGGGIAGEVARALFQIALRLQGEIERSVNSECDQSGRKK
jgi:hypothetical protein